MTGRKKFIISVIAVYFCFMFFIIAQVFFISKQNVTDRSSLSLLNQYYRLSKRDPTGAKRALEIILKNDPNNQVAMMELGYWYLDQGNTHAALLQFQKTNKLYPKNARVSGQLAILNKMVSSILKTAPVSSSQQSASVSAPVSQQSKVFVAQSQALPQKQNSQTVIQSNAKQAQVTPVAKAASISTMTAHDKLLNAFYDNRKKDPQKAWQALNELLEKYPNDVVGLREAGYYALSQHKNALSVGYFERAYQLTRDPMLALQLGYILDGLDRKRQAYYYFDLATAATDPNERMKAEIAKTNLRGVQTQFLPKPFFADLLFYPFYQSRFKLMIYPIIAKVGVVLNEKYKIALYLIYRRTSDNKSSGGGQLPQIYEDNAAITSLGLQAYPIPKVPLQAFIEAGKAVDLVYRDRARWRNDFRTGFVYYNDWGKEARYTLKPTFSIIPNADVYGDLIYYSRFLDTIGTLRFRPGLEVFRYGSTSVNFYYKLFLVEDRDRLFYNNIFERGPSVALTLSDRYNVTIRYESLKGLYLPVGKSTNPYGKTYHNSMIFLDTYFSF